MQKVNIPIDKKKIIEIQTNSKEWKWINGIPARPFIYVYYNFISGYLKKKKSNEIPISVKTIFYKRKKEMGG